MTDTFLGAARLRELLASHDVRPTKTLGQNFVIDPNTIRKMVQVSGTCEGDHVLEVGAGAGSLTFGLLAAGAQVTAVEIDLRLQGLLRELFADEPRVKVVAADATRLAYGDMDATRMVANLPYNVAARIVIKALQEGGSLRSLTVMTQREVGERLAATAGSKIYGLTSVLVAYHGTARLVGKVSRNAFFPVPGVDSAIVQVERHERPQEVTEEWFVPLVKAAFAHRRKTIRRGLTPLIADPAILDSVLAQAEVPPQSRAEDLSLDRFLNLAVAYRDETTAPSR
jgi:16S rRNA (adenine1518-N6/adenine1519-N6)-dimethyltransferase